MKIKIAFRVTAAIALAFLLSAAPAEARHGRGVASQATVFGVESGVLTAVTSGGGQYQFIARWDLATTYSDNTTYYADKKTHILYVGTSSGNYNVINGQDLSQTAIKGAVVVRIRGLTTAGPYYVAVKSVSSTGATSALSTEVAFTAAQPLAAYPSGSWTTIASLPYSISSGGNYVITSPLTIPNGNGAGITISTTAAYRLFCTAGNGITFANGTDTTQHAINITAVTTSGEISGCAFNQGNTTTNSGDGIHLAASYTSGNLRVHDNSWIGYANSGYASLFMSGATKQDPTTSFQTILSYNNSLQLLGNYGSGASIPTDCGGYGNGYYITSYGDTMFFQHAPQYSAFVNRSGTQNLVLGNATFTTANASGNDALINGNNGNPYAQFSMPVMQNFCSNPAYCTSSPGIPSGSNATAGADAYVHDTSVTYGSTTGDNRAFHTDGGYRNTWIWNTVTVNGTVGSAERGFSTRDTSDQISVGYNTFNGNGYSGSIGFRPATNDNNTSPYPPTATSGYPKNTYFYRNSCTGPGSYCFETTGGSSGNTNVWNNVFNASSGGGYAIYSTYATTYDQMPVVGAYFNANTLTAFSGNTAVNVTLAPSSTYLVNDTVWTGNAQNSGATTGITYYSSWQGFNPLSYTPNPPSNLRPL